jgi:hypothetical protein
MPLALSPSLSCCPDLFLLMHSVECECPRSLALFSVLNFPSFCLSLQSVSAPLSLALFYCPDLLLLLCSPVREYPSLARSLYFTTLTCPSLYALPLQDVSPPYTLILFHHPDFFPLHPQLVGATLLCAVFRCPNLPLPLRPPVCE